VVDRPQVVETRDAVPVDTAERRAAEVRRLLRGYELGLSLDFVLGRSLANWADPGTQAKIQRFGGSVRRADVGAGEHITVELPLAPAMASQ
jgi:hypothetical protein